MDNTFLSVVVNVLVAVAVPTITGLVAVGIAYERKKLGLQTTQTQMQTESTMRDKLQNNIITAIGMYTLGDKQGAINYVIQNAGDAMKTLNVAPADLSNLIVNKAAAWAGVDVPTVAASNQLAQAINALPNIAQLAAQAQAIAAQAPQTPMQSFIAAPNRGN